MPTQRCQLRLVRDLAIPGGCRAELGGHVYQCYGLIQMACCDHCLSQTCLYANEMKICLTISKTTKCTVIRAPRSNAASYRRPVMHEEMIRRGPVVRVSALSNLQCFAAVGWLTGRTSSR